jgi:hypothetical protein
LYTILKPSCRGLRAKKAIGGATLERATGQQIRCCNANLTCRASRQQHCTARGVRGRRHVGDARDAAVLGRVCNRPARPTLHWWARLPLCARVHGHAMLLVRERTFLLERYATAFVPVAALRQPHYCLWIHGSTAYQRHSLSTASTACHARRWMPTAEADRIGTRCAVLLM